MIWESVAIMTMFDVAIIAASVAVMVMLNRLRGRRILSPGA